MVQNKNLKHETGHNGHQRGPRHVRPDTPRKFGRAYVNAIMYHHRSPDQPAGKHLPGESTHELSQTRLTDQKLNQILPAEPLLYDQNSNRLWRILTGRTARLI